MKNKEIEAKYKKEIDKATKILMDHPDYEIMIRKGFETEYSQRGVSLIVFTRTDGTKRGQYTDEFDTKMSVTYTDNDPVEDIMNIICKNAGR